MIFMGAPLLAYVQNIVQEVGVCVFSLLAMHGSTASARGQLLRALDALPDAPTDLAREAVETLGAARPRRDRDPACDLIRWGFLTY